VHWSVVAMDSPRASRLKIICLAVVLSIFGATHAVLGDDELSAYESFQRFVQSADPKLSEEAFNRDHSAPPTKKEAEKLVITLTQAAMAVVDQAQDFENRYPQSARRSDVRQSAIDTLVNVFGSLGLPIPHDRAGELETYTRTLMSDGRADARLYLVLYRVAAGLPKSQSLSLCDELSREPTPEPIRSMAATAIQKLKRLDMPLHLSFKAVDDRVVDLADLKGKVVLIDFWSTTCLPCIQELPELKELHHKYDDRGLAILGVSLDTDKEQLQTFIKKEQLPWPQFFDPAGPTNRIANEFGIRSIPVVWIVDRKGILRYMGGTMGLKAKIEAILKTQ